MPLFQDESASPFIYEDEFDLHENEPVGGTHFHMNGFARRPVLTQRQKKMAYYLAFRSSSSSNLCAPVGA